MKLGQGGLYRTYIENSNLMTLGRVHSHWCGHEPRYEVSGSTKGQVPETANKEVNNLGLVVLPETMKKSL